MKKLISLFQENDATEFNNQIPSMPNVHTVIFNDGSGGYHHLGDDVAISATEIASNDIELQHLQEAWNNAYRSTLHKKW